MSDPRITTLAEQLVNYSVQLQPGEIIYLEIKGLHALELGKALIAAATEQGGVPFWYYNDEELSRQFIRRAGQEQFEKWGRFHRPIMERVDARGSSSFSVSAVSRGGDAGPLDREGESSRKVRAPASSSDGVSR